MRLRNIPGAEEAIARSAHVVQEEDAAGTWGSRFGNENPIHIEIGMGKGRFLTELAERNPQINYVGIERYASVLLRALEKLDEMETLPGNLRLLRMHAGEICRCFGEGEVSRIYLNFSDPWPKERHAKRRLTSPQFLARYERILAPDGRMEFKTDNQELFEFSLESLRESGWKLLAVSRDLHRDAELMRENVMTEYEEKFSSLGSPICKLIAARELCSAT
ncbi:MAG: tRNA (guanosine(46)-N7)-methyltransferase TrmB [Lachnospiraceae bacterium]|nr:tRNA (guanosine(46)-N7)-methyltransferase TrmB [Lachnospiraceae bacterium]